MTPDSARGRALGGPKSFIFLGQFLSPIVTRLLDEVVGLTTAFVWVGAVMVVSVVSFGLAAAIMPPPAEPEPEEYGYDADIEALQNEHDLETADLETYLSKNNWAQ